ncbi:hypothetical protein Rhopal_000241-T1 [Rhodotorula paludigena]|uniref:Methyltransferase domain-containing protein n=1 Tax=Rhodotorula paludigena TaxID=86838 RepID=A0AAV5GF79_9BASI|nr:hypothetical protein Rhopal_000241-T1 [Rhodotorula paludigena]
MDEVDRNRISPQFAEFKREEAEVMETITGKPCLQILKLAGVLEAVKTKPVKVIENAGGAGILTVVLKENVPASADVEVVVGDVEEAMVLIAQDRIRSHGWDKVEAKVIDGMNIPYPDESFDFSFIHFGIQLYPDQPKGLSESLRVLRRGGTLGLTTWHSPGFIPLLRRADPSFPDITARMGPLTFPADVPAVLVDAGCAESSVRLEPIAVDVRFDNVDAFFAMMTKGVKGLFSNEERNAKMRELLEAEHGSGPFSLVWEGTAIAAEKA